VEHPRRIRLLEAASCAPNGVDLMTKAGQEYDVLPDPEPNLFPLKGWVRIEVPVEWEPAPVLVWLKPGSFAVIG